MAGQKEQSIRAFITWRAEYDCQISVINSQHQDVLNFINQWYSELKAMNFSDVNISTYMKEKFRYLDFYSKYHLSFEEKMLQYLVDDHGFPKAEHDRHLDIHRSFMKNFMVILADQMEQPYSVAQDSGREFMVIDSLRDLAKWWFNHIKTPATGMEPSPDHVYRSFLENLSLQDRLHLMDRVATYFANLARPALLATF